MGVRSVLRLARTWVLPAIVLLLPAAAHAQSSITGVVKDASGAVLPGVTVEAASPVLIEKVTTAVTDGTGQYRILDLRPGTYTVTFTLTGFGTVKREGLRAAGRFRLHAERRAEGRRARGNGHRLRRKPDRGRPDHEAAADAGQRSAQEHSDARAGTRRSCC